MGIVSKTSMLKKRWRWQNDDKYWDRYRNVKLSYLYQLINNATYSENVPLLRRKATQKMQTST